MHDTTTYRRRPFVDWVLVPRPRHRKPSNARRYVAAVIGTAAAAAILTATGMLLGAPAHAATLAAHRDTISADARMCAAFNRWAGNDSRGDAQTWARWLPGTDGYLYRDGLTFAWAIKTGAPHPVLRDTFEYVWQDCNPDA